MKFVDLKNGNMIHTIRTDSVMVIEPTALDGCMVILDGSKIRIPVVMPKDQVVAKLEGNFLTLDNGFIINSKSVVAILQGTDSPFFIVFEGGYAIPITEENKAALIARLES